MIFGCNGKNSVKTLCFTVNTVTFLFKIIIYYKIIEN